MTAFNNGLALAPQIEVTMRAVSHSKLLGQAHNIHVMAVSNEQTGFRWSHEYGAIFTIVDEYPSRGIEYVNLALLTVRYLKLLHVQGAWLFDLGFEPSVFEDKIFTFEFLFVFCKHISLIWLLIWSRMMFLFLLLIYNTKYC